ncbi:zinc ribbon domain-containing protein [Mycobacterium sp.]|uniref:zinc ribbon domain-containing protein n=1 Tax=Mycobacterium sp. TaxID=1785 RepID=UPI003CC0E163
MTLTGTEFASAPEQTPPSMHCRVCYAEVPTAAFCGSCGAALYRLPGTGPDWLRIRAHAAAPEEQVLRFSVVTTLFPHLAPPSRPAFRAGLAGLVLVLITLPLIGWQAALVAVSALGVPLIYQFSVQRSQAYRDLRAWRLLLTALTGAVLGVAWTLLTGPLLAGSYLKTIGMDQSVTARTWLGLAVPVVGAVLMLVPAVLLRLLRPPTRESLDGYLIGAAGAIAYTAAAAGGLVGALLWFTRRPDRTSQSHRPARGAVLLALAVVVAIYAGIGLVDNSRPSLSVQLGLHLLLAAFALLTLRTGLHLALLHETPDVTERTPLLCSHCRHVVPEMPFCPNCGVATRASSRSQRALLRAAGATRLDDGQFVGDPRAAALFPGYAVPGGAYAAPLLRDTSRTRLLLSVGTALAAAVAVVAVITVKVTPAPVRYACPPDCGRPPIGPPVGDAPGQPAAAEPTPQPSAPLVPVNAYPRFTSEDGKFSVAYFPSAKVTKSPDGVVLRYPSLFDGEIRLFETPAHNRTPLQVVTDYIGQHYKKAQSDYEIPNAMVGYEPGYGEIDDFTPDNPYASYKQGRLLVIAAVKHGLALVAAAEGPKVNFTPKNSGHPSGVNLMIANALGNSVNSFTWYEKALSQ